jgi:hypothetical protein
MSKAVKKGENEMDTNIKPEFQEARQSFTGKRLTQSQFEESMDIAAIMDRQIKTSGSFKEKLGDYAYAFSRSEKFEVMKAETIIRDQFKARYGQTMNNMRETLKSNEDNLDAHAISKVILHARDIGRLIKEGDTMPFYQAYDNRAVQLADELKITQSGAKMLMQEAFRVQEGRELYEWGKEVEKEFHTPKMEAEKQQREVQKTQAHSQSRPR